MRQVLGVFNGEFGTIIDINEMDKEIVIKFDDDKRHGIHMQI